MFEDSIFEDRGKEHFLQALFPRAVSSGDFHFFLCVMAWRLYG